MIKSNITFIGGGNMAYAIAKNMIAEKLSEPGSITVSDPNKGRLKFLSKDLDVKTTSDNASAIESADIIILAVKPQVFRKEYQAFADSMDDKCVVSIMAGVSLDELEEALPDSTRILRTMPNMPAMVGEGMTAFCGRHKLKNDEIELAEKIFSSVGKIFYVDEHLIDAVIGITGSGPAYVFMFMEALADAGVLHGLPRELAYELSAQLLKGSAVSMQETGLHPAELKDRVCSPGGTTIEAVKSLEKSGFRGIVIEAVDQCVKKAKRMQDDRN
ncbi:MAG: pyrroline-5-carboxylate reductase [Clostridia bacterium]|nr:pyrroline-5-carboxylate reductase [Clostridia bacterium]